MHCEWLPCDGGSMRCSRCGREVKCLGHPVFATCAIGSPPPSGPGTELSKLLKRFGIEPTPTCQCRAKATEMNAWGADECEKPERIEEVVAVMRAEAEARGLPFFDVAGRLLVRRAIRNARRAAAN